MKHITLAALVLTLSVTAFAQKRPSFASYAVRVEKVRNVKVKLTSKDARMFRTNLRNAAKGSVNFAGHYILTGWGCGTNCEELAIIDARTGVAYFPRELQGIGVGFCDISEGEKVAADAPKEDEYQSAYYKPGSRLLVFQGFKGGDLNDHNSKCGTYYWEWIGNRLRQVKFIASKRTDTP